MTPRTPMPMIGHRNDPAAATGPRQHDSLIRVRNAAAMALAAASGGTDAIGYLALGHVFTSAMTGNLTLLGIALAHRDGLRIGPVVVSLVCYMTGAALGARISRTPQPGDPVWPPAITRALALEAAFFAMYALGWWGSGSASRRLHKGHPAWPRRSSSGHPEQRDAAFQQRRGPEHNISLRLPGAAGGPAGHHASVPRHPSPPAGARRPRLRGLSRRPVGAPRAGFRATSTAGWTGVRTRHRRLASPRRAPGSERQRRPCCFGNLNADAASPPHRPRRHLRASHRSDKSWTPQPDPRNVHCKNIIHPNDRRQRTMTLAPTPDVVGSGTSDHQALTDGCHLAVDALKLNDVQTIYGVVGIPITDLARLAQARASATSASGTKATPSTRPRRPGSSRASPACA